MATTIVVVICFTLITFLLLKVIADLESQITELNSEMDELKEENNANLSVINRLKDSLQETNTRLVSWSLILFPYYVCTAPNENQVCLDSDETGGCRSPSPPCLSSTASLPSLPSSHPNNNNNLITYSRCPSFSYFHLWRQFVL